MKTTLTHLSVQYCIDPNMSILYFFVLFIALSSSVTAVEDEFREAAAPYIEKFLHKDGNYIDWWDLYGKHWVIKESAQGKKWKTTIDVKPIKYGKIKEIPPQSMAVDEAIFDNGGSTEMTYDYSKKVEIKDSNTWKITTGLSIGTEATVSGGLPGVADFSATFTTSFSLGTENGKTVDKTETVEKKHTVTVPPKTTVVVNLMATEKLVEVPWSCKVLIYPKVAVWYYYKYNGHNLWFYQLDLSDLQTDRFKGSREYVKTNIKGVFKSVKMTKTRLDIKEYEYGTYNKRSAAEPKLKKEYTIDI